MIVFIIGIHCFAVCFWVLNDAPKDIKGDNGEAVGPWINNYKEAVLYSYKVTLGEFDFDNAAYDNYKPALTLWILFIICSIFMLIILLNMLIAIMSESFAKVQE